MCAITVKHWKRIIENHRPKWWEIMASYGRFWTPKCVVRHPTFKLIMKKHHKKKLNVVLNVGHVHEHDREWDSENSCWNDHSHMFTIRMLTICSPSFSHNCPMSPSYSHIFRHFPISFPSCSHNCPIIFSSFPHHFPIIFPSCSHNFIFFFAYHSHHFPIIFLSYSHSCPMIFSYHSHHFPISFLSFSHHIPIYSHHDPWFSHICLTCFSINIPSHSIPAARLPWSWARGVQLSPWRLVASWGGGEGRSWGTENSFSMGKNQEIYGKKWGNLWEKWGNLWDNGETCKNMG